MLSEIDFYKKQLNTEREMSFQDGYDQGRDEVLAYARDLQEAINSLSRENASLRHEMAILVQELQ